MNRNGAYVAIESYAPSIVRITIATDYATAVAPPGYGGGKILRGPAKALLQVVSAP